MRWTVRLSGEHVEGIEAKGRFDAIVGDFRERLAVNGFIASESLVTLDHDQLLADEFDASFELAVEPSDEGEVEPGPGEVLASVLSVDFASSSASELADELDLTDTDFAPWKPSGKTGFTVGDVRVIAAAKDAE